MEDSHVIKENSKFAFYGLFDGHGGKEAATFASEKISGLMEVIDFTKDPEKNIREGRCIKSSLF